MENLDRDERIKQLELILIQPLWFNYVDLVYEYHNLKRLAINGWTIEKTAFILGKSLPTLTRDLRLARAITNNPELKRCKDRKDAESRLR